MVKIQTHILLLLTGLLFIMLFIGGPQSNGNQILAELWNMGHFVLFFLLSLLASKFLTYWRCSPIFVLTIIVGATLLLAFTTEFLQLMVGRSFEFSDMLKDVMGSLAGYSFFYFWKNRKKSKRLSIGFLFSLILMCFLGSWTLIKSTADQLAISANFPNLASFEEPFELKRWEAVRSSMSISNEQVKEGQYSMKVVFYPGKYPHVGLDYLHSDWRNQHQLQFSIYNPTTTPVVLTAKVYDVDHALRGYKYSDRFNQKIIAYHGWNDFEFDLEKIRKSPKSRLMNMEKITSFSLFMSSPKSPTTIYFDALKLTGNKKQISQN